MPTYTRGMFIGGIIGAAMMWLNTTKKGRQTKEQVITHAAQIYTDIKQQLLTSKKWKKMKKSVYVDMVLQTVDVYSKTHTLPAPVKNMIARLLISQWKRLEKEAKEYFS